jgi:hypothetical protein
MNICFSTQKSPSASREPVLKRRWLRSVRLTSLHTFERCVGILGLELIKSGVDFLKSRLRFLLVLFVSSAVQVSYCTVQLLQRRGHFWAFVSTQHAAVLLQRLNGRPNLHARIVNPVQVLGLDSRFQVVDQLLNAGPSCLR